VPARVSIAIVRYTRGKKEIAALSISPRTVNLNFNIDIGSLLIAPALFTVLLLVHVWRIIGSPTLFMNAGASRVL